MSLDIGKLEELAKAVETTSEQRVRRLALLTQPLDSINRMSSLPRAEAAALIRDIDRLIALTKRTEAAERQVATIRAQTIEECAKVAESTTNFDDRLQLAGGGTPAGKRIAATIRALAGKPETPNPEGGAA